MTSYSNHMSVTVGLFINGKVRQGKSLLATVRLDCTIQAKTIQYTIWHFGFIIHMHTVVKEQLHIKERHLI